MSVGRGMEPVFSPEEQRLLSELADKLPRMPHLGWDRERILDEMGIAEREKAWHKICSVILKSQRMVLLRKRHVPVIRCAYIAGEFGYHLVGFTDPDGRLRLYPIRISEGHAGAG